MRCPGFNPSNFTPDVALDDADLVLVRALAAHDAALNALFIGGVGRDRGEAVPGGVLAAQQVVSQSAADAADRNRGTIQGAQPFEVPVHRLRFLAGVGENRHIDLRRDLAAHVRQVHPGALDTGAEVEDVVGHAASRSK